MNWLVPTFLTANPFLRILRRRRHRRAPAQRKARLVVERLEDKLPPGSIVAVADAAPAPLPAPSAPAAAAPDPSPSPTSEPIDSSSGDNNPPEGSAVPRPGSSSDGPSAERPSDPTKEADADKGRPPNRGGDPLASPMDVSPMGESPLADLVGKPLPSEKATTGDGNSSTSPSSGSHSLATTADSGGSGQVAAGESGSGSSASQPAALANASTAQNTLTQQIMAAFESAEPGSFGPAANLAAAVAPAFAAAQATRPAAPPSSAPTGQPSSQGGASNDTAKDAPQRGGLVGLDPNISATEGVPFSGAVAQFTDSSNPSNNPNIYNVQINYGDGPGSSGGMVQYGGGFFTVYSTGHSYAEEGSFTVTTTVTNTTNNNTIQVNSPATVADATLTITNTSPTLHLTAGVPFTGVLAVANDADPQGAGSDYSGSTVSWGDGTATTAASISGSGNNPNLGGTHAYATAGTYTISVVARDVGGASATTQLQAVVSATTLRANPVNPSLPELTTSPVTVATFSDTDGNSNPGNYQSQVWWGSQLVSSSVTSANGQFVVTATPPPNVDEGSYSLTVDVTDSADQATASVSGTASVNDGPLYWVNGSPTLTWSANPAAPPTITNPGTQTTAEGASVNLQVAASDPNHNPLTFDAVGLPVGLSISAGGLISGTVDYSAAEDFGGSYTPTVIVSNGHGGSASTTFSWAITDTPRAPTLVNPSSQSTPVGGSVSLQLQATSPDNNTLTYDATGLPSGLSVDSSSGLISGTPDASAISTTAYPVTVTVTDGTLTAAQSFNWTVTAANQAPTLTNPGNQTNASGDQVSLSLTGSDSDGDNVTWTATGLPPGLTIDPSSGTISGTLSASAASTTPYNVSVQLSDGNSTATQNFTWTVNYVGVTSPGDQGNVNGDVVSLPVTASSAGGTLSYSASNLPPGLTISSSTGSISGTITNTADASSPYATTITASDGTHSASTTFNWSVAHLAATNPGDQVNREATAVSLQLQGSDSDHDTLTWTATGLPSGLTITSGGLISGTLAAAAHGNGPYQVTVTASDGVHSTSQTFVWAVTPRVAVVNPGSQTNALGDSVSVQVQASTVGGTLSYSASNLPPGLSIAATTGLISGTIASNASSTPYAVTVTASDGTSSSSQTFLWSVSPIALLPPGDQANLDGDPVSLPLTTHYHGSGTLGFTATGLPPGLTINPTTGAVSGTVANTADTNSPYSVNVTAADGTNSSTQTFNWTINQRVSLTAAADQANAAGDAVSLPLSASDATGANLTWSASGLPAGLSIDNTGLISGTIAAGADTNSPYAVTVTASDSVASTSISFNWNVAHVALVNPGNQGSVDGDTITLALQGHDADGDPVTYSVTGLPPGLSLNSSTGLISGVLPSTADQGSAYLVTATVTDSHQHSSSVSFLWSVAKVGLSNPGDQTNTEGDTVSLSVAARGPAGPWTYSVGNLPAGLSLNTSTGVISGILAAGAAGGPYVVTVAATNGSVSTSQSFNWTVNPRVTLTALSDQSNVEGNTVSLQVVASDTAGSALTYGASGLPPGLSINTSNGLISGTVAAGASSGGPYEVVLTITDANGFSSSDSFIWTVTPVANTPPTVTNPGTQDNATGDSINLPVVASDVTGDALTFSATGLPDSLSIDPNSGVIFGVLATDAASPTPYSVTVTADNGAGGTTSQTFSWIVNDAALTAQANALSAVEGTDAGSVTVASFSTPDLGAQASNFTATVNWGDGTSDTGTVQGGPGNFTVTADHNYLEAASYPLSVVITATGGTTTTVSSTATVSDAPLTVTGGFDVGAIRQQTTTLTVATFTDGNAAATSDVSATINWGDGTAPMAGTIAYGAGGMASVSGTHGYAQNGSYTVTVTLADVRGATATTTSTITVGDAFAGVPTTLNLSSFVDANSTSPATDFTATVSWGDGTQTTGITVTQANGAFVLPALPHTYASDSLSQPGGVYTVTVTVTDDGGSTLTGTGTVTVVRPPLALTVNNNVQVDPASLTVTNAEVASFTEPDMTDSSAEFSAVIFWGDGTSSSGTVVGSAGMFRVLGSHSYTNAQDDYTIQVEVYQHWDALVLAAQGPGTGTVLPQGRLTIQGPSAVPGMSQYDYYVRISNAGIPRNELSNVAWDFGNSPQVFGVTLTRYTKADNANLTVGYSGTVRFRSGPGTVTLRLRFTRTAGGRPTTYQSQPLTVSLVQVRVNRTVNGNAPFTSTSTPVDGGTGLGGPVRIDGQNHPQWPLKIVRSAPMGRAAIEWRADVSLVPPPANRAAARNIRVGFIQFTQFVTRRVFFATARRYLVSGLVNGMRYIDVVTGQPGPFYTSVRGANLYGNRDRMVKTIDSEDTPTARVPLVRINEDAARTEILDRFWLHVAASTADTGFNANTHYFSLASAEWSFNGSGTIGPARAMGPWTAIRNVTGNFLPRPNQWTVNEAQPVELIPTRTTANQAQQTLSTIWSTAAP